MKVTASYSRLSLSGKPLKDYCTRAYIWTRPIQTLWLNSIVLFSVRTLHCTTWPSTSEENAGRCPHAGWIPDSFFSCNRRKLKCSVSGSQQEEVKSQQHIQSLPFAVWNMGTIGCKPGVMMLRNLHFSKLFLQDQIWMEIEEHWGVFLCMLISPEPNARVRDVTKNWSFALFKNQSKLGGRR